MCKKTGKTPYELWKGYSPNLGYLKVWECLAKVLLPEPKKRKLGSMTFDAMFIGYAQDNAAYRFLVIKSELNVIETNTIMETKNADFFENIFPMKLNIDKSVSVFQSLPGFETNANSEFEPRKSKRARKETNFGDDFYTFIVDSDP
ncbi:hypothetical protein ACFX11_037980 [Malus domestica]